MDNLDVRRVIIVSKTHLDVGFTDYAATVLQRYVDSFIPKALDLAFLVNTPEKKRFVWTTGSYLIKYYLEHAGEAEKARCMEALRQGYVRYHALALTTHTELMSRELFLYDLSIGKYLDTLLGRTTIAAKMTDVPGHTIAMVPALAKSGVTYLHIGVNTSSRVPRVPAMFRWRYGDSEIVVSYAGAYGDAVVLENGVALEFLHALDNSGPPNRNDLDRFYAELEKKYPNATIQGGSLDDFAAELPAVRESLPVVTEEIGDTWIHGIASDPLKTARLRRLLSMADRWIAEGLLLRGSPEYEVFMENLLLVCEHTWGMDTKKHLLDFSNWSKVDFVHAWQNDRTDYSFFGEHNRHIFEAVREELREYRGDVETSSYTHFARSHLEQRGYIHAALAALPETLKNKAGSALSFVFPERIGITCVFASPIMIGDWTVTVGADGALTSIANKRLHIDRKVTIGRFSYEAFDGKDADDCFFDYGRNLDVNFAWSACDFSKPGLRYALDVRRGYWEAIADEIRQNGTTLTVFLRGDPTAAERYGCPREITIVYDFLPETIEISLYWRKKDAIRSPEALWLHMNLAAGNPNRWMLVKHDLRVSPLNVVSGGNRKLHAVERLTCDGAMEKLSVTPHDSPLVSVGGRYLYDVSDAFGRLEDGFWFLLCNNRWGTNFPQWFEEDMRVSFTVSMRAVPQNNAAGSKNVTPSQGAEPVRPD
jgi:hypothetical protein